MRLLHFCKFCKKETKTLSESRKGEAVVLMLSCGHLEIMTLAESKAANPLTSKKGEGLFPYQIEGIEFARRSGFRCLFADEQGVGKTIQVLGALELYKAELLPALFVTKASLQKQLERQVVNWTSELPQILSTTFPVPNPFLRINICSIDSLSKIEKYIEEGYFKTLVIDECQSIKNHNAKRTQAVRRVFKDAKHVIGMSGTPIKNNALEYFPILNLLRPDTFYSQGAFESRFVGTFYDGITLKPGGLKNINSFREVTKDFVIRRTREEVLPDLPKVFRQPFFVELATNLEDAYKEAIKGFEDAFDQGGFTAKNSSCILAYMSRMRHITGISKTGISAELIHAHVNSTGRKIVAFCHHNDVMDLLEAKLTELGISHVTLRGASDPLTKDNIITKFKNEVPVMIASTLAASEGLDLQFCSDCIFVERQWNPANEEQAEGRFPRPGSTADQINVLYPTVIGTIDEFFATLVEKKRAHMKATLDHVSSDWSETSIMRELSEICRKQGRSSFRPI